MPKENKIGDGLLMDWSVFLEGLHQICAKVECLSEQDAGVNKVV